jgi:hypothetical protein
MAFSPESRGNPANFRIEPEIHCLQLEETFGREDPNCRFPDMSFECKFLRAWDQQILGLYWLRSVEELGIPILENALDVSWQKAVKTLRALLFKQRLYGQLTGQKDAVVSNTFQKSDKEDAERTYVLPFRFCDALVSACRHTMGASWPTVKPGPAKATAC